MKLWPEHTRELVKIFGGEYAMRGISPRLIFDLGANLGYASLYFALRYPRAEIYAFEADPYTFKKLARNTRFCKRIHPVPVAVSDHEGTEDFYHTPSSISSSFFRKQGEHLVVPCRSLDSLCEEFGTPDLVKFDVEGAEQKIFSKFETSRISAYVGELHEDLTTMTLFQFSKLFEGKKLTERLISPKRYICRFV